MAKLYFRYGAMGSSKTANALMVCYNYEEKGQKAIILKESDHSEAPGRQTGRGCDDQIKDRARERRDVRRGLS